MRHTRDEQFETVKDQLENFRPDDARVYSSFDAPAVFTLNANPSGEVCRAIQTFSLKLQKAFPEHFYYPADRYHVTIKSFPIDVGETRAVKECASLLRGEKFEVEALGTGVNPYGSAVTAYPRRSIVPLRDKLCRALDEAINYSEHNAIWEELMWITFMRFGTKPSEECLAMIRNMASQEFGTFTLDTYELWTASTKVLEPGKCRLVKTFKA